MLVKDMSSLITAVEIVLQNLSVVSDAKHDLILNNSLNQILKHNVGGCVCSFWLVCPSPPPPAPTPTPKTERDLHARNRLAR